QVLEEELRNLLLDERRQMITLVGRGGIGKTSLALRVLDGITAETRYDVIVWFSARDVDLALSGPKAVRPSIVSRDDIAE
ncbi:NB-ARC domain-containing protein, partial [Staphylococcus aureus]|uniref:NB-ARC domain-containing protein n=1 Tax=Staphylococcus aureus TaxID=1280 RepID=UPI001E4D6A30